jgi:hypothetical protein
MMMLKRGGEVAMISRSAIWHESEINRRRLRAAGFHSISRYASGTRPVNEFAALSAGVHAQVGIRARHFFAHFTKWRAICETVAGNRGFADFGSENRSGQGDQARAFFSAAQPANS